MYLTRAADVATIPTVGSLKHRSDDTPFDRLVRAKGFKNRSELAAKGKMTRALLALVPMGYQGSKGFRLLLKKHLQVDSKTLTEAIQASAVDYLRRIGEPA